LPSTVNALNGASPKAVFTSSSMRSVRSLTLPASTMSASLPPPRAMKISGMSPELTAVCSLPSMSSFWMEVTLTVTSGFASLKAAAASSQYCLPSPVVELCHIVSVVSPPSPSPPPPLVPLQPARTSDPSATTAAPAANAFRIFMLCSPLLRVLVQRDTTFVASHTNVFVCIL
jgi:hypothetical protein